ncbi:MAG: hypothetical protein HFF14_04545 [Angelakisella sp.]|jgi:hypothetical protein|nr:hypothetical protein [Angelakisella sp.]
MTGTESQDPRLDLRHNQLLRECLGALGAWTLLPAAGEKAIVAAASRLCSEQKASDGIPPLAPDREYYIVWDNGDTPVVRCQGRNILAAFDEVAAVAFQTVFLEKDHPESGCWYRN